MLSVKHTSIIQTVDTDAVVLIDIFADRLGCECLIVAIGTGISFRYVVDTDNTLPVFKHGYGNVSGVLSHHVSQAQATARLRHHGINPAI